MSLTPPMPHTTNCQVHLPFPLMQKLQCWEKVSLSGCWGTDAWEGGVGVKRLLVKRQVWQNLGSRSKETKVLSNSRHSPTGSWVTVGNWGHQKLSKAFNVWEEWKGISLGHGQGIMSEGGAASHKQQGNAGLG